MNKIFPKLYEKSSTEKIKHWTISVEGDSVSAIIKVQYGLGDGKIKVSQKIISKGKNLGKVNETSPYEQALSEAKSTWKKKLDKGYVENINDIHDEVLLPMLAHNFQKRGHDIKYPCFVQPKLDGVRCIAKKVDDNTIKYYSRMGKEFTTLEHLTPSLLKIMEVNQIFDGEIYSHDMTFQELVRLVKKLRPESSKLQYHVYDLVDEGMEFQSRFKFLEMLIKDNDLIISVDTKLISSLDDIKFMKQKYIQDGYEGIIIRNTDGMYKLNRRSSDLQKYKDFKDEEFVIVGGKESTGVEEGCVIFDVKNKNGQVFSVRPRGSFDNRKKWMQDLDSIIGKKLTVRYQELTDDGIPRFPVGIAIRDYET